MTASDLVNEFAARAAIAHDDAERLLRVLGDIAIEHARRGDTFPIAQLASRDATYDPDASAPPASSAERSSGASDFVPTRQAIEQLIVAAGAHPLGVQFLLEGQLGAVATMFQVHAFTVEAARQRIREEGAALKA